MKSVIASRKQKWGLGSERHFIYIPLKLLIFFFYHAHEVHFLNYKKIANFCNNLQTVRKKSPLTH